MAQTIFLEQQGSQSEMHRHHGWEKSCFLFSRSHCESPFPKASHRSSPVLCAYVGVCVCSRALPWSPMVGWPSPQVHETPLVTPNSILHCELHGCPHCATSSHISSWLVQLRDTQAPSLGASACSSLLPSSVRQLCPLCPEKFYLFYFASICTLDLGKEPKNSWGFWRR